MSEPIFEVEHVVRDFGGKRHHVRAVDDVSVRVDRGQRLGIVGESGSGKSTLIKMMAGLDRPTSGSIALHGHQIQHLRELLF